jgi:hypothetical protein
MLLNKQEILGGYPLFLHSYKQIIIQCVSLAGSPGKCWFTKRTKVQYICMSCLYEMRLSQVLEMSSPSVNTQLNTTSHVARCNDSTSAMLTTEVWLVAPSCW